MKPQALSHIDGFVVKILGLHSENFKGGILHKEVSRQGYSKYLTKNQHKWGLNSDIGLKEFPHIKFQEKRSR